MEAKGPRVGIKKPAPKKTPKKTKKTRFKKPKKPTRKWFF
jgi:hypothetical protein